ncbi:MAG: efflux RND transporter periplasmic adaptor subunit [Planctomycetota bacterium]
MGVNLENLRIDLPEKSGKSSGKTSRVWKVAAILLAIILAVFIYRDFINPKESQSKLKIETIFVTSAAGNTGTLFSAGGWVEPAFPFPVVVSSLVPGRIDTLNVVENSPVEKGQVIAVLYKKDFENELSKSGAELSALKAQLSKLQTGYRKEEIEQAHSVVMQSKARLAKMETGYRKEEIEKARADINQYKAEGEVKKIILDRRETLFDKGVISKEELDNAKAEYLAAAAKTAGAVEMLKLLESGYRKEDIDEAVAQLREAEQKLNLLENGYRAEEIEELKANVEKASADVELAHLQLSYTEIKAPVSGLILELYADVGSYLTPEKRAIVSIYNPDEIQVRVDVRQNNVSDLSLNQKAKIHVEARKGKPYDGKVIRIDPKANLARDTIRAKVMIDNPDNFLYPEMTATVDFLSAEAKNSKQELTIPRIAVFSEKGKDYIFVVRDSHVFKTQVTLGAQHGNTVSVLSGVKEGEEVTVSNIPELKHNQQIETKGR